MASVRQNELVQEGTSGTGAVAAGAVGLSAVLFVVSLAAMTELVTITDPIAGIPTVAILGGSLALLGGMVISFGVGSWFQFVDTEPGASSGIVVGIFACLPWAIMSGGFVSELLGFGRTLGLIGALLGGSVVFFATALAREDVGSTVPVGAFPLITGLVILTGVIGPSWVWDLGWDQPASLTAEFIIPFATICCAMYAGWASAKAYGGFGATGRHLGAYVLVYLNAVSIVSFLFILVAFTIVKGIPGVLTGAQFGRGVGPETTIGIFGTQLSFTWPIDVPFVMNGVALLNEFQGVLPAIVGTFWLVVGAILFAVPLGVGAAIFLTEYAEHGLFTRVVEIATNGLWSTPSIVFGLFGFAFLVPRFGNSKSLLSGMITLGFMLLPLVLITSREAMISVPNDYRDASAALGVSRWQTIRSVVLPAALPGVVTGVILGVGRIAGETAPILLTMAGGTFVPGEQTVDVIGGFEFISTPPFVANPELLQATSALPYQLFALITAGVGLGENVSNPDEFRWATALVLLIVVLSFYAIGIGTRYYFRRKLRHD